MRPHLQVGMRETEQPRCHTLIQNSFNSVGSDKLDQKFAFDADQNHPKGWTPRSRPRVQG